MAASAIQDGDNRGAAKLSLYGYEAILFEPSKAAVLGIAVETEMQTFDICQRDYAGSLKSAGGPKCDADMK